MADNEDVTWGDNVIYAEFGKGPSGKRRGRRSKVRPKPPTSSTIEKLLATQDWAGAFTAQPRRGTTAKAAVEPRTTFARWIWEFIIRGADAGRVHRGEKYRFDGNVLGIRVAEGYVIGEVQGSQPEPFSVFIRFPRRDHKQVEEVLRWLVNNPSSFTEFERGELPFAQMEKLFCDGDEHVYSECTCPDPAPVCKHTVAVAAQLIAEIDQDPLSSMQLRGYTQRELQRRLQELTALRNRSAPKRLGLGGVVREENKDKPQPETESSNQEANLFAVEADYWGNDLERVEIPSLDIIEPLVVTDRTLLHDALQPACVVSRETIRAVADLEDCWYHLQQSLSLGQKEL
ncbi:MAG: hypothetical protein Q4E11_02465 [Corynebacterium sp.]|uniref:SWIM zinc finger family protein n=1 Tax=Corynebacterium sp. TaxID=1720 RepID=UPI0026DCFA9E|nr:hypothetical protein [Corynebacterium sp.]MDO5029430.1 hypothetical protein [Corynebacterium sp.]